MEDMHRLRMILGSLRVLDAVHRTRSVAKAADALCITAGAVSQQLKELEARLGVQLLHRDGRRLEFTQAGRELALSAAEQFDRLDAAVRRITEVGGRPRLRLRVMPSFAIRWLAPRLASFYADHPEIDLELATINAAAEPRLEDADFIVLHGEGEWTDLHMDHIFDDALTPVCSPALAERLRTPQDLHQVNMLRSMIRPDDWETWLGAAGITERFVLGSRLGNAALCYRAAADGLGVAIGQLAYVSGDLESGRLVAPFPTIAKTEKGYYLACELRRANTFPLSVFRAWMRSVSGEISPLPASRSLPES
jgi:DNA-binding transcriptional LysR family regulator